MNKNDEGGGLFRWFGAFGGGNAIGTRESELTRPVYHAGGVALLLAGAFALLLEGAMTLADHSVLAHAVVSYAFLAVLVTINALYSACSAALDQRASRAAGSAMLPARGGSPGAPRLRGPWRRIRRWARRW